MSVYEALEQWIIWVCEQKENAPPAAIAALPEVVRALRPFAE